MAGFGSAFGADFGAERVRSRGDVLLARRPFGGSRLQFRRGQAQLRTGLGRAWFDQYVYDLVNPHLLWHVSPVITFL